ncbi:group II intron reverse transcriptase/maturase [Dysgonomonas sp. GY75]|uniref:group II intron reverse transcriptase/maturase n=1 Tax=Dysgonomonas sp. GY75 TaxID=2780419 RepID=UPI0018838551|nr:group II intron reverse transcriptase/maturase [Dysgonomonas sp. GY75]MBF0649222.1 group II intron reverse transcriptase/maturase [Dysgonomonas sp. GY75]
MRNSERVLNSLTKHSKLSTYKYERLYRVLFNEEMYYVAYQRIYSKPGNMTPGSDGKTIDGMNLSRIEKLIQSLKDESYQPQPSKRTYIPKKNGKVRPLGIPAFDDKLVQEVIRMILEAIYEEYFENCSYGFRPKRSCHTALSQIQKSFSGAKWFVEGDIKGFFDNIDHDIMIDILKERISDERFLRLVRKFLNAGYVEDWQFHKTHSGTPQGGIVSPILANIYLDKLDKYIMEYIREFDKGEGRKTNIERRQYECGKKKAVAKLKSVTDKDERKEIVKQIKAYDKARTLIPSGDEMDCDYRKMKYVRYADDFLIGIIGNKEDSKRIKEDIKNFLHSKLKLELSDEKTLITHTEKSAKFLGYEIYVRKSNLTKRDKRGRIKRAFNKKVYLKLSTDIIKKKLLEYGVLEIKTHNGKEQWKPKARSQFINNDDLEILDRYNSEIRGFYNYYSIANNCSTMHSFKYIMEYSMYKTFAGKYRSSVVKIACKYKQNKVFTVHFKNKKGEDKIRVFYNEGFKRKNPNYQSWVDNLKAPITISTTSLIDRLKAEKCELCGATDKKLDMHHVRKLKGLDKKKPWEKLMIARQRKTIALCKSCHKLTDIGKQD